MDKSMKDYLHLYLGCEAEALVHYSGKPSQWIKCTLVGMDNGTAIVRHRDIYGTRWDYDSKRQDVKPILRPLSDMTEEEKVEVFEVGESNWRQRHLEFKSEQFSKLLSKGFDLFNLIPDGLAIDKTKLSNQ